MKYLVLAALIFVATANSAFAQNDAAQQEKDQDVKERIYGTKHPWENTLPYGTQYTPPQSGAGTIDSASEPEKKSEPDAQKKTKPKKKSTLAKKPVAVKPVAVKSVTPAKKPVAVKPVTVKPAAPTSKVVHH